MTLEVWTARISSRDPDALDVTRAGADKARKGRRTAPGEAFAPSAGILARALATRAFADTMRRQMEQNSLFCRGEARAVLEEKLAELEALAWAQYWPAYLAEMRESYRRRRPEWDALLARPRVVLVCFCVEPKRCHRTLLAGILGKLGAVVRGELAA